MVISLQVVFISMGLLGVVILLSILFPVNMTFSAHNINQLIDEASRQRILRTEIVIAGAIDSALGEVQLAGNTTRALGLPLDNIEAYQRIFTSLPVREAGIMTSTRGAICRFYNGDEAMAVGQGTTGLVQIHRSSNGIYQWQWGSVDQLEQITEHHIYLFNTASLQSLNATKLGVKPILLTSKGFAQGVLWNSSLALRRFDEQMQQRRQGVTPTPPVLEAKEVRVEPWYVRLQVVDKQVGGLLYPLARMVFRDETLPFAQREPYAFCTSFLGDSAFGSVLREYIFGADSANITEESGVAFLLDTESRVVAYSHGPNLVEEHISAAVASDIVAGGESAKRVAKGTGCFFYNAAQKWIGCLKKPDDFPLLQHVKHAGWDLANEDEWSVGHSDSRVDSMGFRKVEVEGPGGDTFIATSKAIETGYHGFRLRLFIFIPQDRFTASVDRARDAAVGGSVALTVGMLLLFFLVVILIGRRTTSLTRKMVRPWTSAAALTQQRLLQQERDEEAEEGNNPSAAQAAARATETTSGGEHSAAMVRSGSFLSTSSGSRRSSSSTREEGEEGDDDGGGDWCPFLTRLSTMLHLEELEKLDEEFSSMGFYIEKLRGFVNPSVMRAQLRREQKSDVGGGGDGGGAREEGGDARNNSSGGESSSLQHQGGGGGVPPLGASTITTGAAVVAVAASSSSPPGGAAGKKVSFAVEMDDEDDLQDRRRISPTLSSPHRRLYANNGSTAAQKHQHQLFCVIWFDFPLVEKMVAAISRGDYYPQNQKQKKQQEEEEEEEKDNVSVGAAATTAAAGAGGKSNQDSARLDLIALTSAVAKLCHHLQSRPITVVDFLGDSMLVCFRIKNLLARSRILDGVLRRIIKDSHAVHRKLTLRNEYVSVFGGPRRPVQEAHRMRTAQPPPAAAASNGGHQQQMPAPPPLLPPAQCVHVVAGICVGFLRTIIRSESSRNTLMMVSSSSNSLSSDPLGSSSAKASEDDDGDEGCLQQITFVGTAIDNARRIARCLRLNASAHVAESLASALSLAPDEGAERESPSTPSQQQQPSFDAALSTDQVEGGDDDDDDDDGTGSVASTISVNGSGTRIELEESRSSNIIDAGEAGMGSSSSSSSSTDAADIAPSTAASATAKRIPVGVAPHQEQKQQQQQQLQKRPAFSINVPYALALPQRLDTLLGTTHDEMMPLHFNARSEVRFSGPFGGTEKQILGALDIRSGGGGGGAPQGANEQPERKTVVALSRVVETPDVRRFLW